MVGLPWLARSAKVQGRAVAHLPQGGALVGWAKLTVLPLRISFLRVAIAGFAPEKRERTFLRFGLRPGIARASVNLRNAQGAGSNARIKIMVPAARDRWAVLESVASMNRGSRPECGPSHVPQGCGRGRALRRAEFCRAEPGGGIKKCLRLNHSRKSGEQDGEQDGLHGIIVSRNIAWSCKGFVPINCETCKAYVIFRTPPLGNTRQPA